VEAKMERKLIFPLLILVLVLEVCSNAQEVRRLAQVPKPNTQNILPVVIYQPNCPIRIEAVSTVLNEKGQIEVLYRIRNISGKDIKDYSIARWFSSNTGTLSPGVMPGDQGLLKVGEAVGTLQASAGAARDALASNSIGSTRTLSRLVFVMIGEVVFANGDTYSDLNTFDSLRSHLELFETDYQRPGTTN